LLRRAKSLLAKQGIFPDRDVMTAVTRNALRYLILTAVRSWRRNLGTGLPALVSTSLLLLLLGVAGVLGTSLNALEQTEARQAAVLHAYLRDDANPADVTSLQTQLNADPRVASVLYVSKVAALLRAQRRPGLGELGGTDSNPFPASFDIQVRQLSDVSRVDLEVRRSPTLDPVIPTSYDAGAYRMVQALLVGVAIGAVAVGCLLSLVAITVTANSIRAAIGARRDELRIMQLVGASRWMVRGPFLIEGALTGVIAGVAAGAITIGLCAVALRAGSAGFNALLPGVTTTSVGWVGLGLVAMGVGLGSGSSMVSLHQHLRV
jgi:cell division protein FtsX